MLLLTKLTVLWAPTIVVTSTPWAVDVDAMLSSPTMLTVPCIPIARASLLLPVAEEAVVGAGACASQASVAPDHGRVPVSIEGTCGTVADHGSVLPLPFAASPWLFVPTTVAVLLLH